MFYSVWYLVKQRWYWTSCPLSFILEFFLQMSAILCNSDVPWRTRTARLFTGNKLPIHHSNLLFFFLFPRGWWWWWVWGRKDAILLWLRHALPDCVLEGSVCARAAHWLLEWLGVFHRVDHHDWRPHSVHWRPGIPFWMHCWPERLCNCGCVCGAGNLCARYFKSHFTPK